MPNQNFTGITAAVDYCCAHFEFNGCVKNYDCELPTNYTILLEKTMNYCLANVTDFNEGAC